MTSLSDTVVSDGPDGFVVDEDGAIGTDLLRPGGRPLTDVTPAMMTALNFDQGWIRSWADPAGTKGVGILVLHFAAADSATVCATGFHAVADVLPGLHTYLLPGVPDAVGYLRQNDQRWHSWIVSANAQTFLMITGESDDSETEAQQLALDVAKRQLRPTAD